MWKGYPLRTATGVPYGVFAFFYLFEYMLLEER